MQDIYLARTAVTPEVNFKFSEHKLSMTGETYPENSNDFFHPLLFSLKQYLGSVDGQEVRFDFRLTYFNSAATKMLYNMFELLNNSACTNNRVIMNWHHDDEDDTIREFGEDVKDDYRAIDFRSIVTTSTQV